MKLIELPSELILLLPPFLHSIDDLYSLLQTCRTLYQHYADSRVALPPIFAKRDGQRVLPPHPHLLLSGTARQIADWAVESKANRHELLQTLPGRMEGLLSLAERVTRLSLADLRELYRIHNEFINPLYRRVDAICGQEYVRRSARDEAEDEEDLMTICGDVTQSLYSFIIYCELFHHNVDALLDTTILPLSPRTRRDFLGYCMPDENNFERFRTERLEYQVLEQQVLQHCRGFPECDLPLNFKTNIVEGDLFDAIAGSREEVSWYVANRGLKTLQLSPVMDPTGGDWESQRLELLSAIENIEPRPPHYSVPVEDATTYDDNLDGEEEDWVPWEGMAYDLARSMGHT